MWQLFYFFRKLKHRKDSDIKELEIGIVTKYFGNISVAAIKITADTLKTGDAIHIKGHTTDFKAQVESMQIEHNSVSEAKKGDSIGLKVSEKARRKDKVFKIIKN